MITIMMTDKRYPLFGFYQLIDSLLEFLSGPHEDDTLDLYRQLASG